MVERPCANPACFCETSDVTCSLWCGALDRPAGIRCLCRHDHCARPLAHTPLWSGHLSAAPTVRQRLQRRPPLSETA